MSHHSEIEQLLSTSWRFRSQGKYDQAQEYVKKARALAEETDYNTWGRIYHVLMQFESDQGNFAIAGFFVA